MSFKTEDTPFTITMRIKLVRRVPESVKSVMEFSNTPDLTVVIAVSELGKLNVVDLRGRSQWLLSASEDKVDVTTKGRRVKAAIRVA